MEELKKSIDNIGEERKQIIEELKELRENPIVKRYFELNEKNDSLLNEQKKLIKQFKIEEFNSCQHLWVITKSDHDYIEGRTERFYGCVKCGLNQEVLTKVSGMYGTEFLTFEEQIILEYLENGRYMRGSVIPVSCDIDLAKSVYSKIKENNPDIDDETAQKYFEIALDNIRKTKVSDERKENRAKRLSLSPNFNKWNARDVEN